MTSVRDLIVAATCAAGLALPCLGTEMSISSSLVGGFDSLGGYSNTLAFQNYFTGSTATGPQPDRRSFYIFGIPAMLPGPVISARLELRNPWVPFPDGSGGAPGYFSDDVSETFRISDTPFAAPFIAAPHTTPEALSIWATLGSGELYGSADVSPAAGPGEDVVISLTPAAVGTINVSLGSAFVIGGLVSTLDGTSPDELIFGYSDIPSPHMVEPRLVLTFVPSPGVPGVLVCAALLAARRCR
ncbi:MAG: hypothetical protein IT439_06535 [Phycisphaerales bacterium]|nr:hypothetical protein [Phycisphaerales bacterium]